MNAELQKNIKPLTPYTAGEYPNTRGIIKLNTNEAPYPPSPEVIKAFKSVVPEDFGLYPDPESRAFKAAAAKFYGLDENQILPANGSDDSLALIFMTFFNSGKPVLFPDITYSFYKVWCSMFNVPYKTVPLSPDFKLDPRGYTIENGGIIIANPNAPTGVALDLDDIRFILDKNPGVVVVIDEAYIDFGGVSAVPLLSEYENLVVVHTFSKYRALAGMRIALSMANAELISCLNAAKNSNNSYPLSCAAQGIAAAALEDDAYYRANAALVIQTREKFVKELDGMGFNTLPSSANFIFTTHKSVKANDIFVYLKEQNIYVRYFNAPKIDNFLRITIGTQAHMDAVTAKIRKFMNR